MSLYRRVFLSYDPADSDQCARIANWLRRFLLDVWMEPTSAQDGYMLSAEVARALQERTLFVLMVSTASNASQRVQHECAAYRNLMTWTTTRQVNGIERMILPVRLNDEVPAYLRDLMWIDATQNTDEMVAMGIAHAALLIFDGRGRITGQSVAPSDLSTDRDEPPASLPVRDSFSIPISLTRLGFRGWRVRATGVEYIEPPTCQVGAGSFLMGSADTDLQAYGTEKPRHSVPVDAFAIGTYPVTVTEYTCYLRANPDVDVPPTYRIKKNANWAAPEWQGTDVSWQAQQTRPDHPVVCVSWYNARNYAAWLTQVTGQPWRLPTEAEWEKAARWDEAAQHARMYPWGDKWDAASANSEGGPNRTTPVGSYPTGASPFGVQDMAGNVWEWTSSVYEAYPYRKTLSEFLEHTTSGFRRAGNRVIRGGAWNLFAKSARTANRTWNSPDYWYINRGFRVVSGAG